MIKWLVDGTKVRVVSKDPLIVTEIVIVDGYDEQYEMDGKTYTARNDDVYDSPPVKVLNERVSNLNEEIHKLTAERNAVSVELRETTRRRDKHIKKMESVDEALQNLDDIFSGNITHFVCLRYHDYDIIAVDKLEEKMSERYDERSGRYIMALHLKKEGDGLSWKLTGDYKARWNTYLSKNSVIPCSSYKQAVDILARAVNKDIQLGYLNKKAADAANKYNFPIPDDYESKLVEHIVSRMKKDIENHKKHISDIEEKIKEITTTTQA